MNDTERLRPTPFDCGIALPTLAAGGVRLRSLRRADVPALFTIFGDPEVTRYWGHAVLPDLHAAEPLLADIHEGFAQKTKTRLCSVCCTTIGSAANQLPSRQKPFNHLTI